MMGIAWRDIGLIAASLVVAFGAGLLFHTLQVPLAWVLGPLVSTATLSVAGLSVFRSERARRAGQLAIGAGLGLHVTASLLAEMLGWLPYMLLLALVSITVTSAFSVFLARMGRLDRITAYFALMPGGLTEMANIGARMGAASEPIALSQAIRVALVVCLLPPVIVALGIEGTFEPYGGELRIVPYTELPLLFGVALIGVLVVTLARANNPWVLGALIGAAVLSSTEVIVGAMPRPVFYGGQLMLGMAIGGRFRREIILRLPRMSVVMSVFTVLVSACLFGLGMIVASLSTLDPATAALATSAGGMAEMALTAQFLNLSVALVVGFHVVRAILVNGFSGTLYNLLVRIGFFATLERLDAWLFGARRE